MDHIANLAVSNPVAVSARVARLILVTTANVSVAASVAITGAAYGISVHQMTAQYKMVDGNMSVRFVIKKIVASLYE